MSVSCISVVMASSRPRRTSSAIGSNDVLAVSFSVGSVTMLATSYSRSFVTSVGFAIARVHPTSRWVTGTRRHGDDQITNLVHHHPMVWIDHVCRVPTAR